MPRSSTTSSASWRSCAPSTASVTPGMGVGSWSGCGHTGRRTIDIDGVVITLQDVSERRQAEDRLRRGEERLRLLIDGALEYAIFTMSSEGVIDSWNSGAQRMFQYSADEAIGQNVEMLFTAEDRAAGVPARELAAGIRHRQRRRRAVSRTQGRQPVLLQRHCAAARREPRVREDRPRSCRRSSRRPTPCASSRPISTRACGSGRASSRRR